MYITFQKLNNIVHPLPCPLVRNRLAKGTDKFSRNKVSGNCLENLFLDSKFMAMKGLCWSIEVEGDRASDPANYLKNVRKFSQNVM